MHVRFLLDISDSIPCVEEGTENDLCMVGISFTASLYFGMLWYALSVSIFNLRASEKKKR